MNKKQKKMLVRIILAAVLMIVLAYVPVTGAVRFLLYLVPYLIIGYDILLKAAKGIRNRQVFDECFLMVPELCGGKKPQEYQRADGYPSGLCQCGTERKTGTD